MTVEGPASISSRNLFVEHDVFYLSSLVTSTPKSVCFAFYVLIFFHSRGMRPGVFYCYCVLMSCIQFW